MMNAVVVAVSSVVLDHHSRRILMDEQKTSSDSSSSSSSSAAFQQSLPLCIGFAVFSGLLRVCATMVLAYPDFLEKKRIVAAATEQSCHRSDNLHTTTTFTPTFTTTREHPNSRYFFLRCCTFIHFGSGCHREYHFHIVWTRQHCGSRTNRIGLIV
jgi:hypothetical protein